MLGHYKFQCEIPHTRDRYSLSNFVLPRPRANAWFAFLFTNHTIGAHPSSHLVPRKRHCINATTELKKTFCGAWSLHLITLRLPFALLQSPLTRAIDKFAYPFAYLNALVVPLASNFRIFFGSSALWSGFPSSPLRSAVPNLPLLVLHFWCSWAITLTCTWKNLTSLFDPSPVAPE